MNRRTAIVLATKATILAEITECTVDEAIRFLAAVYATRETELVRISIMTNIPLSTVRKLSDADSSMTVW